MGVVWSGPGWLSAPGRRRLAAVGAGGARLAEAGADATGGPQASQARRSDAAGERAAAAAAAATAAALHSAARPEGFLGPRHLQRLGLQW
jgi:hypothetical protein